MRSDSLGMFWQDEPPVAKVKAEKQKRTPPVPTWLEPGYLPGLEVAKAMQIPIMDDNDLLLACQNRETLIYDTEVYPNYFLVGFRSYQTGKVAYFEMTPEKPLDIGRLNWVMQSFCTVGFNSISFDLPITTLALAGKGCDVLKYEADQMILFEQRGSDILRKHKVKKLQVNHIDLIEVAPLRASLKIYGGRLHTPAMQDLPFHPSKVLNEDQIAIVRWYCLQKDLTSTAFLRQALDEQLILRENLSNEYGIDLRSKSDAQIAESVIRDEITRLNGGHRPQRPTILPGTAYRYRIPHFLRYQSAVMQWTLQVVQNAWFVVDETGAVGMPPEIKDLKINIGNSSYTMGIGGLHSTEKTAAHHADENTILEDRDVTSYYPFIILNQGLYPPHLGINFLRVYRNIVDRRLDAKRRKLKKIADSLKITINGSFGKLGSKYSDIYAPDLLIQVTITGQLALLMLIERLEMAGIPVVSANTDGVVSKCPKHLIDTMTAVVKQWEIDTGFETEGTRYQSLYSRDVNNYIAVKVPEDGKPAGTKAKGAYAEPGLQKNPTGIICVEAIEALLTKGVPPEYTITTCTDIRKFAHVRTVSGGAVKLWPDGSQDFLGKAIRWYYATGDLGELVYAKNGNKVPKSDGAMPLMDLPAKFPTDVDYEKYIAHTNEMLIDIGYKVRENVTAEKV